VSCTFLVIVAFQSLCGGVAARAKAARPPIVYAAVGDSITWGLFASRTCQPAEPLPVASACRGATSFPVDLARALASNGREVRLQNLAISGARVSRLLADELGKISVNATLITVFVGINDFSDIAFRGSGTIGQFEGEYTTLVRYLLTTFPRARLVLLNVPNIAYLPCCTGSSGAATWQAGNAFINGFANVATVVDLVCDLSLYGPVMFPPADGIHPSDAGHARIAADVFAALNKPRKPAAACPPFF
jgi:lysophospholipase L1-like esterase